MDIKNLESFKTDTQLAKNSFDEVHLNNYKQLILFFENALKNAAIDENGYASLVDSYVKCIRFLDNVIFSYEMSSKIVQEKNNLIDTIAKQYSEPVKRIKPEKQRPIGTRPEKIIDSRNNNEQ
tara:strand:+ start:508 stop:876 length:369 start_codon:yes stop_codon:yes gene_type:complete